MTSRLQLAATRWGPQLAMALLLCSLLLALLVPLYSDEVTWRLQLSRLTQDGVDRFISDTCGANTFIRPPVFMWPVRLVSAFWTSRLPDPRVVRIAGVALAAGAAWMVRSVITQAEPDRDRRAASLTIAYLLLGLGVLPWLQTMSRPEQPVLLLILAGVATALFAARAQARALPWLAGLIAFFAIWSFAYHLKALFYLPVFLAALWIAAHRRLPLWLPALLTLIMLGAAASAYHYWSTRFQCPADPVLRARLNNENLSAVLLSSGLPAFVRQMPHMLRYALPDNYIKLALPAVSHTANWLTPPALSPGKIGLWRLVDLSVWAVVMLLGAWAVWRAIRARQLGDRRVLLAVALGIGLAAWGALQSHKNDYEASLYLPLLLAAVLLLVSAGAVSTRLLQIALVYIAPVCLAAQLLLYWSYLPHIGRNAMLIGYIPDQSHSIPVWSYPDYHAQVIAAAAKCGIRPDRPLRHLLVDDGSYFVFSDSYQPLHYIAVTDVWTGMISDPGRHLSMAQSSGAVLACKYLNNFPDIRARAIASGELCCLPAAGGGGA